jgi:hypothetical protein
MCNRLLLWFVFLVSAVCFVFFREGLVVRIGSSREVEFGYFRGVVCRVVRMSCRSYVVCRMSYVVCRMSYVVSFV